MIVSSSPSATSSRLVTFCRLKVAAVFILVVLVEWIATTATTSASTFPSSSSTGMILRIRRANGSMDRILIPEGTEQSMTLEQIVAECPQDPTENDGLTTKDTRLRIGDAIIDDLSQSISQLGLKHGSLITILPSEKTTKTNNKSSFAKLGSQQQQQQAQSLSRWDPFPDLAKDYDEAVRQYQQQQKQRQYRKSSSSYTQVAQLQSQLHIVEPQPEGPLLRVYMCRKSAERFHANGPTKTASTIPQNRMGLLLGTLHRERKRAIQNSVARTSLSTTPSDQEYCQVAKVHCIWEPPQQQDQPQRGSSPSTTTTTTTTATTSSSNYDASQLMQFDENPTARRVLELAEDLGLMPVGWIYTYSDDYRRRQDQLQQQSTKKRVSKRSPGVDSNNHDEGDDDGSVPPLLLGPDIVTAAQLEMAKMKSLLHRNPNQRDDYDHRIEGKKFVTLAMDAITGATEAFQLSDVVVQMVSEGLLLLNCNDNSDDSSSVSSKDSTAGHRGRFIQTKHAIIVDGQETNQLDPWLCLINTALLSHEGDYCTHFTGKTNPVTKKNKLTSKTKKSIRKALEEVVGTTTDGEILQVLSDFSVLLALDSLFTKDEMKRLCQVVHKYVRGQKVATRLDSDLKQKLKNLVSS